MAPDPSSYAYVCLASNTSTYLAQKTNTIQQNASKHDKRCENSDFIYEITRLPLPMSGYQSKPLQRGTLLAFLPYFL